MKSSTVKLLRVIIYGGLCALAIATAFIYSFARELNAPHYEAFEGEDQYRDASLSGHYLAGRQAAVERDYAASLQFLRAALIYAPNDSSLLAQAMQLELMNGNIEDAVPLALRMEALGITDGMGLLARALYHAKYGTYSAALEVLEQEIPGGLYLLMRPLMRHWAAIATNPPTRPISLAGEARKAGQLAPFILYQEALMNDVLGFDEAVDEAFAIIANQPQNLPFRLMEALLNHQVRTGQLEEAALLLASYRAANPDSSFADETLLQANNGALVGSVHDGLAELYFTSASILMGQEAYSDAAAYLQMALSLNENLPPALFMLASIYEQNEQYGQAIATYGRIAEGTPYFRRGQVRQALNMSAMGNSEAAIEELKAQAKANPNEADPLISLGDTYRIENQFDKAAKSYSEAINIAARPSWTTYYARGISYEREKEWEKAEADFTSALSLEPNQPDVLNYLGYSLLERNERLDEALEMIEKALEQRPYAGHIIDSMGWALYKNGEYADAVDYLERAAEITPHDPTVNDHLGDAYWRVGRKIEAKFQWERALSFDPDAELRAGIEGKLESGLEAHENAAISESEVKSISADYAD